MGQPISLSLAGTTGICTSLCQLLKLKTSSPRNCGTSTFHHGKWKWKLVTQSCPTLCDPMEPTRLLCPWNSPGKNSGVGCHFLLQGIFPTQGSNPGHHIAKDYLPTEPPGKPWISLPLWRKWQTQGRKERQSWGHPSEWVHSDIHCDSAALRLCSSSFYSLCFHREAVLAVLFPPVSQMPRRRIC